MFYKKSVKWFFTIFVSVLKTNCPNCLVQKDNTNLGWRRISWSQQKFEQLCDFPLGLIQGVLHFPCNTWPWFLSSYIRKRTEHKLAAMAHLSESYTETEEPVPVPKRPSSKIPIPWHSEKPKLLSSFQGTWKWLNYNIIIQPKRINIQTQTGTWELCMIRANSTVMCKQKGDTRKKI